MGLVLGFILACFRICLGLVSDLFRVRLRFIERGLRSIWGLFKIYLKLILAWFDIYLGWFRVCLGLVLGFIETWLRIYLRLVQDAFRA